MKRVIVHRADRTEAPAKRYKVHIVAKAIYRTEGSIAAYINRHQLDQKAGLTIDEIAAILDTDGGNTIKWDEVDEIQRLLEERHGITFDVVEQQKL